VAQIARFRASIPPGDIEERFPQARGWGACLAKPSREADLLIRLDNQRWMPKHVSSSLMEGDNLWLMQSVLGPACMLMGCAMRIVPSGGNQGRTGALGPGAHNIREVPARTGPDRQDEWRVRKPVNPKMGCLQKMIVMAVLLISVADPGCLYRIPDPDLYPSRIPDPDLYPSWIPDLGSRIQKQQQRGVKQNLLSYVFFVATNFTKLKIILFLKCLKKKIGSTF
jgi:hypothetical protein